MADLNVCPMLTAGSNAHNSINVSPNTASGADKVINSLTDNSQVKGAKSDEDFLKGLLSDAYCHVCSSQLMSESHRLAHYEGKKHAQKVKVFLEAARAETTTGAKHTMLSDKNRFCELCNMVFSSNVVAKSHYEGKVHAKNLRKQSQPSDKNSQVQDHRNTVQKPVQEENKELQLDPAPAPASCDTEVDLKDPNKYCPLCAASFNNSQMALQHYNGRKHHRNQSRQALLKQLGDDVQQGSVEIYQAHLQGNKHQTRKKKISDLCKSQPKVYSTFADELADYIEVQKARGVTPRTNLILPQEGKQKDNEEDREVEQEELIKRNWQESSQYTLNPVNHHHSHHHPGFGTEHPLYLGPVGHSQSSNYTCPLFSSFPQFSSHPPTREQHRRLSVSPPYSTSSYSSYSSHTSESDEEKHRPRGKRRIKRLKRDGGGDEETETKGRRRKRRRRERDSEEKEREPSLESEEEEQKKTLKSHRCKENESQTGKEKTERETLEPEHMMGNREETRLNTQTDMNTDQSGNDKPVKSKPKKEKKRSKEKADTRTEEEKLWDDSILGW
ncbi:zinc finger matrin-type protein 1 isoform X2 [Austrofundulus limnaeus]|uniref:Lysine-rich coiled-coil protein 1 n=1 Tax=Austrofundulus limnaeus TaxID=52670 RepID=A0A2I4BXN3_AUSLI|nr:PREDICTED: lysine-rich coiled-coil protein 1 isoform X2 [Austrofundulus limnaeus]